MREGRDWDTLGKEENSVLVSGVVNGDAYSEVRCSSQEILQRGFSLVGMDVPVCV